MKIVILTFGTYGDVQPYLALGHCLKKEGFTVTIATHEVFKETIISHGFDFSPLTGNPKELLDSENAKIYPSHLGSWRILFHFAQIFSTLIPSLLQDSYQACKGADAIICSSLMYIIADTISQKYQIPLVSVFLQPMHVTGEFSSAFIKSRKKYGSFLNKLSWKILELASWIGAKKQLNAFRKQIQMPPIKNLTLGSNILLNWESNWDKHCLMIYAISPALFKRPSDWKKSIHISGYLFLEDDHATQVSPELVNFLTKGRQPFYIGFGSMLNQDIEFIFNLFSKALRKNDQRAIFCSGWSSHLINSDEEHLFLIKEISHEWLFPQVKAVIHHGGAGTTARGLKHGKPTLIFPHLLDQFFWGHLIYVNKLGPKPIDVTHLSVDELALILKDLESNPTYQAHAKEIAVQIEKEKGGETIAKLIKDYLKNDIS